MGTSRKRSTDQLLWLLGIVGIVLGGILAVAGIATGEPGLAPIGLFLVLAGIASLVTRRVNARG